MVESIGKLREWASQHKGWSLYDIQINEIADEIEREIAELQASWAQEAREHADDSARLAELAHENAELKREIAEKYMLLPVDADGVPIHVGDEMEANGEVLFVAHDKVVFKEDNASPVYRYAKGQRHAKPDPVKELLEEFATDLENYKRDGVDFDCFAERIREAVGA